MVILLCVKCSMFNFFFLIACLDPVNWFQTPFWVSSSREPCRFKQGRSRMSV